MLVMDVPEGYVYRALRTECYKHPSVFSLFAKEIKPCLELVWTEKLILEETAEDLTSPAPRKGIAFRSEETA
jgi:hypothetical protein